jgi:hypothetical protein
MFSSARTSTLRQRALDALGFARSFLLLEDDTEVDWEVGQDEWRGVDHPHRVALRGRGSEHRRPGGVLPREHVCLCPLRQAVPRNDDRRAGSESRLSATR